MGEAVSWVDTSRGYPVLTVAGKPFLYLGTQLSPHRLRHFGWEWADMEKLFAAAAADNVTVLAIPLLWDWVEHTEGHFDWQVPDTFLDWGRKYGLRLEILWFGSNVCGKSLPPEGTPQWALDRFEKACGPDGSLYFADDFCYAAYKPTRFYKLDPCDEALLAAETGAVKATFDHIGEWQRAAGGDAVVVGAQILNEATCVKLFDSTGMNFPNLDRSYSKSAQCRWRTGGYTGAAAFNTDVFWEYLHGLSGAVKSSAHSVWCRVNLNKNYEGVDFARRLIEKNEAARAAGGTNIDFIGDDPYVDDAGEMFRFGGGLFATGQNLPMVMENDGAYPDTVKLIFNAMAGGAAYNIWELVSSGEPGWQTGFYAVDHATRTLAPKPHRDEIRGFFGMLRREGEHIAALRPSTGQIAWFNRDFAPGVHEVAKVGGVSVTYAAQSAGGGLAVHCGGYMALMSTGRAVFTVAGGEAVEVPPYGCARVDIDG